jgi:acetolactate synthase I/II/III large subunit
MKGYEALAQALVDEGVEVIFGILGGDNDNLVHQLDSIGVRYIQVRHEGGAVGMADGYSRASGKPGVATVTLGPGLTNTATPLSAARLSRSSVLLLVGDKRAGDGYADRFGNMMIDHQPFIMATAGAMTQLSSTDRLAEEIRASFRHVRRRRGPMVFNFPWNILDVDEMAEGWAYTPSTALGGTEQLLAPDPLKVKAVARLLANSKRPVILAGRGAVKAGARDELLKLGDRIGAVLATSLLGKGWFAGHPFNVGVSGGFSYADSRPILKEADLVIAFGASLSFFTLDHGRLYRDAKLINVDNDIDRVAELAGTVDQSILGDARLTAEALLAELGTANGSGWRTAALEARVEQIDPWRGIEFVEKKGVVDPRLVTKLADELLPRDRQLIISIGHFMGSPAIHMNVNDPTNLVFPWRLGQIGCGVPVAVGAAVGRPDRLTVLFEGDGGLMATLPELETAARYKIPLLVIVIDDGGYGAERYGCMVTGKPTHLVDFDNPDFAQVARSLGLDGFNATSAEEVEAVLRKAGDIERPTLLNVKVNRDVYTPELFSAMGNFRGRKDPE